MSEPTADQLTAALRKEMAAAAEKRGQQSATAAAHDDKRRALAYQLTVEAQEAHFAHRGDDASRPPLLSQSDALDLADAQLSGKAAGAQPKPAPPLAVLPKPAPPLAVLPKPVADQPATK